MTDGTKDFLSRLATGAIIGVIGATGANIGATDANAGTNQQIYDMRRDINDIKNAVNLLGAQVVRLSDGRGGVIVSAPPDFNPTHPLLDPYKKAEPATYSGK